MIFLECIDFTTKYLKAWILLPMYLNRLVTSWLYSLLKQLSSSCFLLKLLAPVHLMVFGLQHITAAGTLLIQQAEDVATNQVKYLDLDFRKHRTDVMELLLTQFYIPVILFLRSCARICLCTFWLNVCRLSHI